MNNYELHSRAQELAASNSDYKLARRFLALEEELQDARREFRQSQQAQGEAETLTAICDLLGIGKKARNHSVIMTCIGNIHRFSEMLHAVEHKFFMVPGETDEDYTSEERGEECLVNSWGSTKEQYLEQFERALDAIRTPAPAAVPYFPTDEMIIAGQRYLHSYDLKLIWSAMFSAAASPADQK